MQGTTCQCGARWLRFGTLLSIYYAFGYRLGLNAVYNAGGGVEGRMSRESEVEGGGADRRGGGAQHAGRRETQDPVAGKRVARRSSAGSTASYTTSLP